MTKIATLEQRCSNVNLLAGTALERSVLKYWRLTPILRDPNLALSFCYGSKHIGSCSVVKPVIYRGGALHHTA